MQQTDLNVLNAYADEFRDLVNSKVWGGDEAPEKLMRLNDPNDWSFICVAMDVIGDASLAIENFLRFSLDGPTRYEEVGERYLRLYGLLNATYIQQEAVQKLFKLMNCPNPKLVRDKLATLVVRVLRNKVASHSVDFRPTSGGGLQAFVPIRVGLHGFICELTENRGDRSERFDLRNLVQDHTRALIDVMDAIYEKSYKTLFKVNKRRSAEFAKKLEDLRYRRDGNIIVRAGEGENAVEYRVSFVSPRADEKKDHR